MNAKWIIQHILVFLVIISSWNIDDESLFII